MSTGHDHSHRHGNADNPDQRRRLLIALGLTWIFAVVEAIAGWSGGSLALLADAGHMITDGAALGLALLAAWVATRPPSARHSYGMGRVELLAALINALSMLAVVFGIGWEAWLRFSTPRAIDGVLVSGVALVGLLVNLGVAWIGGGGYCRCRCVGYRLDADRSAAITFDWRSGSCIQPALIA